MFSLKSFIEKLWVEFFPFQMLQESSVQEMIVRNKMHVCYRV